MAKNAEQLIILGDIGSGLLARLYMYTTIAKPDVLTNDPNVLKYTKQLLQTWPNFPNTLEKHDGHKEFVKRSSDIVQKLGDFYATFMGVLNFADEAWRCLVDCSKNIVEYKPNVNPDLMKFYLDLFLRYVQVTYMVTKIDLRQELLASYAKAHHCTSGNTEPNFLRIADYLKKYENPLRRLQDDSADISMRIGDSLMPFSPIIFKWSQVKQMVDTRVFNVVDEPKNMTIPFDEKSHVELLSLDNYKRWVLYGFLICPAELQRPGALEMLSQVLRETFVLQIYRDKCIPIHEEFSKLFTYFVIGKNFKLRDHKHHTKSAYADPDKTVETHYLLRTYLRVELETLLNFFREYPGTIPPKIQLIFAVLRLARDEVLWYFRHQDVVPYKAPRKYQWRPDEHISHLLYFIGQLGELVAAHKRTVQEYYAAFLTTADKNGLFPAMDAFQQQNKMTAHTQQLFQSIKDALNKVSEDDNFEVTRLNWYRLSAQFVHSTAGIAKAAYEKMGELFSTVIHHTRCVDILTAQLREHSSFMTLFWYRADLHRQMGECLKRTNGSARHCLSYVKVLNDGLQQVHRVCPEEQVSIGKEAIHLADTMLREIVAGVERILKNLVVKTRELRSQTLPIQVVARAEGEVKEAYPGYESLFEARRGQSNEYLRIWRKSILEVSDSFRETDTITVYNIEFVPREYLYESMSYNIRQTLRLAAMNDKNIERPSVLLHKIKDIIYSYNAVERHITINLCDIVRDVLLSEFWDDASGMVGETVVKPAAADGKDQKKDQKQTVLVHTISQWYFALMQREVDELGISYSGLRKGFVSRAVARGSARPAVLLKSERWCDITELKALCTLAGPYGVRCVDNRLLTLLQQHVGALRDMIKDQVPLLTDLRKRFNERAFWVDKTPAFPKQVLDKFFRHSVIIGCVLRFRQLLREGLSEAVREKTPFIWDTVRLAQSVNPDISQNDARLSALDNLAMDCGLDVKESDHSLRFALQRFKTTPADVQIWSLLPEMYGLCFSIPRWSEAQWAIETEGHVNNAHCAAAAVHTLIAAFNRMPLKGDVAANVGEAIQSDLERYIKVSSHCILHMNGVDPNYPLPNVMTFVEQFITTSNGRLSLGQLEEYFPFTLLRSNYIRLTQQQSTAAQRSGAADIDQKAA